MKSAICIAGAGSGVGKTTITIGLLRALSRRGLSPAPFKCGPDYIDPGFHKIACDNISRNLDTWMMGETEVKNTFYKGMLEHDTAVVEGVMGLFDGAGIGKISGSTAHVAKILELPILLVVNARGIAGTIAPLIKGFVNFKKGVNVVGIIANNVGSERHAEMLAEALIHEKLPPLLGFLPRNPEITMPERHLGLVPITENQTDFYDILADNVEKYFKIDEILAKTRLKSMNHTQANFKQDTLKTDLRLAIAKDEAFHFYYEDNLDLLRQSGIELVPFSPISDSEIPENINGIYIGGGFPECFAAKLAKNTAIKQEIAKFADSGGFIYAECGGFMYLTNGITTSAGEKHKMAGIIPVWTKMEDKMRALGYREIRTTKQSPLGPEGTVFRGHEFHWSSVEKNNDRQLQSFCEIRNARQGPWSPAGFSCKNVYASYIHAHWASNNQIIENLKKFIS